jgi:hypothetical protein
MNPFPLYISIFLIITVAATLAVFYKASKNSGVAFSILIIWLLLQTVLGLSGFYSSADSFSLRFFLLVAPALFFIILLFATVRGRTFIDNLDLKTLTLLHTVRLPIEIILALLAMNRAIPELMTFEGRNFDIISGVTAPLVYYIAFIKKKIGAKGLLAWNVACLLLLFNIVVNGVLSVPSQIQQFAFEQPNVAMLYFPFVWIPSCVVVLVLFSHLAAIRQLVKQLKEKKTFGSASLLKAQKL